MAYAKDETVRTFEENLTECLVSEYKRRSACGQLNNVALDPEKTKVLELGVFAVAADMTSLFLGIPTAMRYLNQNTVASRLAMLISDTYSEPEIVKLFLGDDRYAKVLGILESWINSYRETKSLRVARDLCRLAGAKLPEGLPD